MTNQNTVADWILEKYPESKFLQPFSLTVAVLLLFFVWTWIDGSSINYEPGRFADGRITAEWIRYGFPMYILGSPILVGIGLVMALPFAWIARKTYSLLGWLAMLLVFIALILHAWERSSPEGRMLNALKLPPPPDTQILRLLKYDSFSDGTTTQGVCTTTPEYVDALIAKHQLKTTEHAAAMAHLPGFPRYPEDRHGSVYRNSLLEIYHDQQQGQLYFSYVTLPPPNEREKYRK